MLTDIVRQQTPEQAELLLKREELTSVRGILAQRELELTDLRIQLGIFEARYLRQVGVLYAELDEWEARIAELVASRNSTPSAQEKAAQARKQADETYESAHGEVSQMQDFEPSADLKRLFREVAKRIHPDFAEDAADQQHRTRLMAQANEAYSKGNTEALTRILDESNGFTAQNQGEGIGAELIRIIRQIHQAKKNIAAIDRELLDLGSNEIAQLKAATEGAQNRGQDLLAELAVELRTKLIKSKQRFEALKREDSNVRQA